MKTNDPDFAEIFQLIPQLKFFHPQDFRIDRISGFTNNNYRLRYQQYDWILRVPKPETNECINRDNESFNIQLAIELELAPESLWRSPTGLSLTPTCRQTRNFQVQDMLEPQLRQSLMLNICRLHSNAIDFHGRVDIGKLLPGYFQRLPDGCKQKLKPFVQKALTRYSLIERHDNKLVPSHNDLVLQNILVGNSQKMWIIDWEYSAMASPYWDLATLCNATKLNQQQIQQLLALYREDCDGLELDILLIYRFLLQALSICWMALFTEQDLQPELDYLNSLEF